MQQHCNVRRSGSHATTYEAAACEVSTSAQRTNAAFLLLLMLPLLLVLLALLLSLVLLVLLRCLFLLLL
jgi:hypothetical protein